MWVKGRNPDMLCELVTRKIAIQLELKGEFRWIVFLPNRSNGTGALTRYYGMMKNGKLKVRGIDMRRSDMPHIIRSLQEAMLGVLAEVKNASEFYMKIPETIEVLREYMIKVLENECALADMVFKTRVSHGYDDYRQFNAQTTACISSEGIIQVEQRPCQQLW
jgi:DNA polymerase elongation subunit (family B)